MNSLKLRNTYARNEDCQVIRANGISIWRCKATLSIWTKVWCGQQGKKKEAGGLDTHENRVEIVIDSYTEDRAGTLDDGDAANFDNLVMCGSLHVNLFGQSLGMLQVL